MREIISCKIHTRIADDRLVPVVRLESISFIIDATDFPARDANECNASMNSGSRVMLV